ncbi:uroporphyrinogen-III synthase [Vulcaniibacterium tengchongense]|uniref:Uroporphyrinogen-III synthase n=1 Tax=Vulcaniibacterium tengchongense TaxID=1273429 RepID=A0A3N4W2C9_9GAMM|nr:uroporphyrinogen-III synthase [Vulcaniibacterium tengchongense]RPE80230.1 uroporphyrinogen-III synthase [Vulcaniibacterium tengchongense]
MSARTPPAWYVISLRPRGEHAPLRRAAARRGAGLIALSPWRLRAREDDATRAALRDALRAHAVLFTSPAAVRAARALQPLRARRGQRWLAVGAGTAAALRRAGVDGVLSPARMDSEGLLALPELADLRGARVGFVTAPGGRGMLAPALHARGAELLRADVYEREPVAPAARDVARLRALAAPAVLALSSGEALQRILDVLPPPARAQLLRARVAAASERLAALARAHGFAEVRVARGPRPRDLVDAAAAALADAA